MKNLKPGIGQNYLDYFLLSHILDTYFIRTFNPSFCLFLLNSRLNGLD